MHAKLRKNVVFVLVLTLLAVGGAQEPPESQRVVERFAEALSAGRITTATGLLASNATWSEHDLFWRTASGTDTQIRVNQLVRADVRIETEVIAVLGHGQVVIAAERMWGDFVPEGMAPLRSTTVYVVESGWLVGITRVLSAEQRDALTLATIADTAWDDGAGTYHRFDADGTYRNFDSMDDLRSDRDLYFSGTYQLERGVFTWVADADSRVCNPGERLVMRGRMSDQDTWIGLLIPDRTDCAYYRSLLADQPVVTHRLADE